MPFASFLDKDHVAWAIVGGYVVIVLFVWTFSRFRNPDSRKAYGCITGIGLAFLLGAMALLDWLIDHVF